MPAHTPGPIYEQPPQQTPEVPALPSESDLYVSTKHARAWSMPRGHYNAYRGWTIPEGENPDDPGYLVEGVGGASNHPDHTGYISWLPTSEFLRTFIAVTPLPTKESS